MNKLSRRGAGKEKESRLFVLAAVLLFLVLNLLLTYLANTYGWYFLAIDPMYYTLSGATDEFFEEINPEDARVEFYFCMSETELNENHTFGRILDTVKQFEERYEFFSIKHLNTYYDFALLDQFAKEHDTELTNQSVILYSPDTKRSEVRSLSTFYYYDTEDSTNDDMIYNGEEIVASLTSAVLGVERQSVLFTMGHGEAPTVSLLNAFYSAGYDVLTEDISSGDIPEEVKIVVIAAPRYDFEEYADATIECEITRLRAFVERGGTVIYLRNASAGKLPRIDAFYSDLGITPAEGMISDPTYAVDTSGKAVLLRYDEGEGAKSIREYALSYNASRLVAAGTSPLSLSAGAVSLLTTYSTAYHEVKGEKVSTAPDTGYTVAAVNHLSNGGNVALISAEAFAEIDTMETDGYGNKEFLFALLRDATGASAPIGCGVLQINTYPLEDMTRGTANLYLAVFGVSIPLAVAVAGFLVIRRRTHR